MQKTLQQLIIDTERMLYQAVGSSVQVYSQDNLRNKIQEAFENIFQSKFWPQFIVRETRTLNGTTGKTTAAFTSIREWQDVHSVFRRYSSKPIPQMPLSFNTLDFTGTQARYLEPANDATLFTVYPLGSIDQIVVVGRARPAAAYALTNIVPFDYLALEYFAAWSYLIDDGGNPPMAEKYQGLFSSRLKQLWDDAQDHVVPLNPHSGEIPMEWR